MRCIKCGHDESKVIDSRSSKDGFSIRRRRECLRCGNRFTTYETVERHDFRVVKRNGERVGFDRDKLMGGLLKACEKRKVPYEVLERVAEEIVAEFQADNVREVPTSAIGLKVMEKLRGIDPVAYVRYASVYRQFQDVGEFIDEINAMGRRPIVDPMQQHLFPLK
ncbi:MAG: transcriptional regulator NrdR [Verrucomicrobiales bacterium]